MNVSRRALQREATLAALAFGLYWLAAQLGFVFSDQGILTPVWPPAAVAVAIAVLYGPARLWMAAIYVFVDLMGSPALPWQALLPKAWIEPLALLASAMLVRQAARRWGLDPRITRRRHVALLVALSGLYAASYGAIISAGYCGLAHVPSCARAGVPAYWWQSFIGDFFGCLIVLPGLLSWLRRLDPWLRRRWPEPSDARPLLSRLSAQQRLLMLAGALCVALGWLGTRELGLPVSAIGFLALPLLVWAALQCKPLFVHTTILVTGLTAISLELTAAASAFQNPKTEMTSMLLFLLSTSTLTLLVNVIVQQQQTLARSLAFKQEQERVEWMLQAASDSVLSFDASGRILYANPSAQRLLQGADGNPLAGQWVHQVLPCARLQALPVVGVANLMQQDANLFSGAVFELNLGDEPAPQGPTLEVALTAYHRASAWHGTAFIRNVSARKQVEAELRKALDHQRELNDLKSRFVAMTSHEFRTPLSTIQSSAELLHDYGPRLDPLETERLFDGISQSIARMTSMMDDILIIGQSDVRRVALKLEPVDIDAFCANLLGELRLSAPPHLQLEYAGATCIQVDLDARLLRQILSNLLFNAIKYSPKGGVVRLEATRTHQALHLRVSDQGIGIPAADLPRLFESFHRASNVGTIPGTGLGLSIVQRAVERQGGEIGVHSVLGEGTTVWIKIPLPQEKFAS